MIVIVNRHDRAELRLAAAMHSERRGVVEAQLAQYVFPIAARKALDQNVLGVPLGDRKRRVRILVGRALRLPVIAVSVWGGSPPAQGPRSHPGWLLLTCAQAWSHSMKASDELLRYLWDRMAFP